MWHTKQNRLNHPLFFYTSQRPKFDSHFPDTLHIVTLHLTYCTRSQSHGTAQVLYVSNVHCLLNASFVRSVAGPKSLLWELSTKAQFAIQGISSCKSSLHAFLLKSQEGPIPDARYLVLMKYVQRNSLSKRSHKEAARGLWFTPSTTRSLGTSMQQIRS